MSLVVAAESLIVGAYREVATTLPHRISTIIKIANNHHILGDVPRGLDAGAMVGQDSWTDKSRELHHPVG